MKKYTKQKILKNGKNIEAGYRKFGKADKNIALVKMGKFMKQVRILKPEKIKNNEFEKKLRKNVERIVK